VFSIVRVSIDRPCIKYEFGVKVVWDLVLVRLNSLCRVVTAIWSRPIWQWLSSFTKLSASSWRNTRHWSLACRQLQLRLWVVGIHGTYHGTFSSNSVAATFLVCRASASTIRCVNSVELFLFRLFPISWASDTKWFSWVVTCHWRRVLHSWATSQSVLVLHRYDWGHVCLCTRAWSIWISTHRWWSEWNWFSIRRSVIGIDIFVCRSSTWPKTSSSSAKVEVTVWHSWLWSLVRSVLAYCGGCLCFWVWRDICASCRWVC